MRNILQEFNQTIAQEDLFLSWENELRLRKQLRAVPSAAAGLVIENADDFNFLRRSLYYSEARESFLQLLYYNRDNLTVLACLGQARPDLTANFLAYIADSMQRLKPSARDLQFLINLYRTDLQADFRALIAALDEETCAYLMARTSNKALRELLQMRRAVLSREDKTRPHSPTDSVCAGSGYPTLFGDKLELMAAAAKALRQVQDLMAADPLRGETITALLQSAEMLFRSGLIADCLALVADLVRDLGAEVFNLLLDPAAPYYKPASQLLRKAVPFYCLLVDPADPHHCALELYRTLFPGFSPDPASLLYLDINSIVIPSLFGNRRYAHFELAQMAAKLKDHRPDDLLAAALENWGLLSAPVDLYALQQVVSERIKSVPHEALAVMGVLRLGQREGKLTFDQASASRLLQDYLLFFDWIPAASFMNQELWQQLGPLANRVSRRAGERVIKMMQEFLASEEADSTAGAAQTGRAEEQRLGRQLLLSKYMGVL